jgi:hypothetical protein
MLNKETKVTNNVHTRDADERSNFLQKVAYSRYKNI